MIIYSQFPLGLTGWISFQSQGLSRVFSSTSIWKHQSFGSQSSFMVRFTSVPDYWKNHSFDYTDLFDKVMSLLFNILSRFVIAFFPRSKYLLISWLQSSSPVVLELKKIKYVTAYTFSISICHEMMGRDSMILVFFVFFFVFFFY